MSTYQQLTTTQEQQQHQQKDIKKSLKKSKSKKKKTKTKPKTNPHANTNNKQTNQSFNSDIQINQYILKPQNRQQNGHNSTVTKMSTITTDRKQPPQRQIKLNYFMNKKSANDSTSFQSNKYAITQYERKRSSLEKQLSQKDSLIQKLKAQKQVNIQKFAKLKLDAEENRQQTKKILQSQLRESAKIRRLQKAQINPKMGYYKQASWTIFVEGDYILQAKKKLETLQKRILQLESKKRNLRQQQRERISFQIDYLFKEKNQASLNLKHRQTQLNAYKDRLRLADKQSNCTLAKANWPLLQGRYVPLQLLGSGGFGQVYKCYDLQKTNYVAIKTNCFQPTKGPQHRNEFIKHVQRQVATLKTLNHPNIVKMIDQITIDNKISFVLEYCSGPQLSKYLSRRQHLEEKQARGIIKQISFALRYMFQQKNRIIHYDLKPANIIFHYGCVKILDFGLCKKMDTQDTKIDLTSQGVGTYWYLPPQTFKDFAQISSKVDVWSLGVIFYELLYGKRPFGHGINQTKIMQDGIILNAIKVEFPADRKFKVSDDAKDFIRECLRYNPQQRLDPQQVYQHSYLNQ